MRRHTSIQNSGKRGGFSLVELMIAVGILGVGLIFSSALFTAAVKENASSAKNSMGTLMCKNALAMARVRLTNGGVNGIGTKFGPIPATKLGPADLAYPIGDPDTKRGCVVLGGRMVDGKNKPLNDYLLVFVAYKKSDAANSVEVQQIFVKVGGNSTSFPSAGLTGLQIGSPVIAPNGNYAWIIAISDGEVQLDRAIDKTADVENPFIIVEVATPPLRVSPAMSVMGSRTGLQKASL